MAEFKLGRIRLVWQGAWTTNSVYVVDDVVRAGGSSYICVKNHTSSALFETDLIANPTYWEIVSGGLNWRGDWAVSQYYNIGDQVKYGGIVYICNDAHTSAATLTLGLEDDDEKWDPLAESLFWTGAWSVAERYRVNDLVAYGGTTYVCNLAHTSTSALAVLATTTASASGGTATIGFATQVVAPYAVGASITVAGVTPTNFNGTFTVTACTTTSVQFALIGTFGPQTIAGTVSGTSQLGLEADLSKWDIFNQGFAYTGDWADDVRYKLNDIVKYGANTWICITPHTSVALFDNTKWEVLVEGLQFEDSWSSVDVYQQGDLVTYGGYSYIAKQNNTNKNPTTELAFWSVYTTGFNFLGDWNDTTVYYVGDVVRLGGYTYVAILENEDNSPPDITYWARLNQGIRWTNTSASYAGVDSTTLTGSGSGAQFDVVRTKTSYTVTVTSGQGGTNYANGNTLKILGTDLGGISPANDILVTVLGNTAGAITSVSIEGFSVTWSTGTVYVLGDLVFWGANTYICVDGHTASTPTRPDNDTAAEYWNLFSAGAESAILTTAGDTYYYGENGPARLPLGADGQVLRVRNGYPAWAYYGVVNNIVYVAPAGTDSTDAGWGLTIDKPWGTVRFACEQIEKGYRNRNAILKLATNKQFIMKEVTNWVIDTYSVAITASSAVTNAFTCGDTANLTANMPIEFTGTVGGVTAGVTYYVKTVINSTSFTISNTSGGVVRVLTTQTANMTGTLSYDQALCERDAGLLVDALIYDLGHGGNEESTRAAKSYYTVSGSAYINSNFGQQATQTVAAYNFLKTLVAEVLDNTATVATYQVANSVPLASRSLPIVDVSTASEEGAIATSEDLLNIITDGIEAGTASAIPTAVFSNTTVSVKTGTFFEVLPIVIPKNTAVVGDELRSTVVSPQPAIPLLASDKEKTISALNRIKSIASTLVLNDPVTPSANNTVAQVTTLPDGSVGSSLAVPRVIRSADTIYDVLNNGINSVPTEIITDPTNWGSTLTNTAYATTGNATGSTTGYNNARIQIANNYAFIQADVSRYIQNNFASVWTALGATGQAKCQRDIAYILDAIRYDLTYGGNTQSLIAGSAYYSGLNLTIASSELTATIAAYTHLKSIITTVAQRLSVTAQAGNVTPQVLSGSGGPAVSGTFAQDRVQIIIDWINNVSAPATVQPATSWVDASLLAGFTELQARRAEIQSDGLAYARKFFQSLNFNEATCSRDIGLMVDAIGYDTMFDSNFASVIAGESYHRGIASTLVVLNNQKAASLGLIKFLKYKIKNIATGGAAAQIGATIDDIVGTIKGGAVPRFLWPDYTGVDAQDFAAAKKLTENALFIQAEVLDFVNDTYPSIEYSEEECARDVGYIVDALRYDLTYGGHFASKQAGIAYYSRLTSALQIDSADKAATLAAYGVLKTVVQDIAAGLTAYTARQVVVTRIGGSSGDAASATRAGALIDIITNIIDTGLTTGVPRITITAIAGGTTFTSGTHNLAIGDEVIPQTSSNGLVAGTVYYVKTTPLGTTFTLSTTYDGTAITSFTNGTGLSIAAEVTDLGPVTWVSANLVSQNTLLSSNKATIQQSVINYISANYPNLNYNSETCARDVGYIVDAIRYDLMFGSNFRSIKAGMSYYQAQASLVIAAQKRATLQAFRFLKGQIANVIDNNASAETYVKDLMTIIINILDKGVGETPEVHGTLSYANNVGIINAAEILRANSNFLQNESTAWIRSQFGGTVTTSTLSNSRFTTSASHNLSVGDPVVFTGSVFGGVTASVTYWVLTVPSSTTFTISNELNGTTRGVTDGSGSMTVSYSFNEDACKRDMQEYIESIIFDLNWAGNYKSARYAVLYKNAVEGSEMSDMFHVSNATGLRNCTLRGLEGDLSEENDYGTKRPTAGAYVALNPGFGPNDSKVWVTSRSHYSQNVTMFGFGCTGAKIDSALHAGGNKSMVKNDFTTILSDGIGVWCTGADSLTELVSVFAYYSYAGYIAELGGRIRATNGNTSYGTYGVIAEGVDSQETPLFGTLDNRSAQAQITNTVTDATNEILRLEYGNAGTNYTNTQYTINGSGFNAEAIGDEFRDGAVFETRIIDLDNGDGVGGTSYVTAANAAQSGDITSITIAATDQALSSAYVGMRIQITAGTGVGQFANILTYQTGSKVATVYKDSFASLTVSTTTDTGDFVNVASNATLYVNMPIYFTGTVFGGVAANTVYYVKSLNGTTQFTISATSTSGIPGATFNVTTGSGTMTILEAGWDHTVPGTPIENALNLTTTYTIEPRISYSAPGYTTTARTLSATATWKDIVYGDNRYVAVASGSTSTSTSVDGVLWANAGALSATATWTDVVYGGGEGALATVIVGGFGGVGAVLEAELGVANTLGDPTADQVARVRVIAGGQGYLTPPTILFTAVSGGTGAVATCTVLNGAIATVTVTVPGSGYNAVPTVAVATDRVTDIIVSSYGKNYFGAPQVTIDDPYTGALWSSGATVVTNDIITHTNTTVTPNRKNWYRVTTGGSFTTTGPTHTTGSATNGSVTLLFIGTTALVTPTLTNNGVSSFAINYTGQGYSVVPAITILDTGARYVAIASGSTNNCFTTRTGIATTAAWTAGSAMPASDFASIAYGGGTYVIVGGTSSVATSTSGSLWQTRTIPTLGAGTYSAVAYGNRTFVAISTGNVATAVSSAGASWTAGGNLPTSTAWSSIAYGNGRFVAIASSSRAVAVSLNKGVSWIASPAGLPISTLWTKVAYGQGQFVAIASGTNVCATSPDGITWTARTMPSSSSWAGIEFGNPNKTPTWIAVSNSSGTIGATINTGAQATGRIKVASGVVIEARMLEPGSGYSKGTVSATTATTNLITVSNTINLANQQPVEFFGTSANGLIEERTYYVIGSTITSTQFKVAAIQGSTTPVTLETGSVTNMTYRAGPVFTVTDPNKVRVAAFRVRLGDGALGNPSFTNRGADNATATADTVGDGFSDLFQVSTFVSIKGLSQAPTAGANVEFASIPGEYYKLVAVTGFVEDGDNQGTYKATFQINPALTVLNAPRNGDLITTRLKYSQVRLTGHDYLYIGTGNQTVTNYPNVDISAAIQDNQELFTNGGRVFFTSTDQDGNFNVGGLFGVQQATGTATLNASAFNLSGLNSLQLGSLELGIDSAIITQFSTDPFFTADSDNVVPTQRAIRAYITAQIGGGQSALNVNTLTAGVIFIAGNSISTTTGEGIDITSKMNFTGGIDGAPVALGFFMQR